MAKYILETFLELFQKALRKKKLRELKVPERIKNHLEDCIIDSACLLNQLVAS